MKVTGNVESVRTIGSAEEQAAKPLQNKQLAYIYVKHPPAWLSNWARAHNPSIFIAYKGEFER